MQKKIRVLAVEDDASLRLILEAFFSRLDYDAQVVPSVEDAFEYLEGCQELPQVVLSDVWLGSGKNGWDLLQEVRQKWQAIPVIMVTSEALQGEDGVIALAAKYGAAGYIVKPMDSEALRELLTRALNTDQGC